jgi:hypothetical protein
MKMVMENTDYFILDQFASIKVEYFLQKCGMSYGGLFFFLGGGGGGKNKLLQVKM